jgi:hypothetical protein
LKRLTKLTVAAPALIVIFFAIAGGAQIWGQHQARMTLDQTLANLPPGTTGHYDDMSFNFFTRTLRIQGFTIARGGHPAFSINEAVLHHLSGDGSAANPLQASVVRLVGVELWKGGHSATAALVQAVNVSALAAGVQPPAGLPKWLLAPEDGTLLSADSIAADGITDDEGATLSGLSITGYNAGQIHAASAAGFADKQGNKIASASVGDIDLGGIDAVFDTGRYLPGAPRWAAPRPLIGHIEINGFRSDDDGGLATIDHVSLDDFAARPFAATPNTRNVKTWAFRRDAAAAVTVGSFRVSGFHFRDSATKTTGTLAALSISGYADGALARFAMAGLEGTTKENATFKVGHVEVTGFDAAKLLHDPAAATEDGALQMASHGGVRVAGISLSAVSVKRPTGSAITLESVTQTTSGTAPAHFALNIHGLTVPADIDPDLAQALGAIGLDKLVLDLIEIGSYDAATADATVKRMVLTARGLGSLEVAAQMSHMPRQAATTLDAGIAAITAIEIGSFSMTFTNDSLVQRLIAVQARQQGKTPDDETNDDKLAASLAAASIVLDQPDAGAQIGAFIADPKTLTITANPATPVPLASFLGSNLDAARSALNLHLSAQ